MNAKKVLSVLAGVLFVLGTVLLFTQTAMANVVNIDNHSFQADGAITTGTPTGWSYTASGDRGVHNVALGLSPRPDGSTYNYWRLLQNPPAGLCFSSSLL